MCANPDCCGCSKKPKPVKVYDLDFLVLCVTIVILCGGLCGLAIAVILKYS